MSDYLDSPKFLFGFQVHHLLPVEMFSEFDQLLMRAGVSPVRLKPDDWTSGNNNWLLDVIAPDSKTTASVIANFGRVVKEVNLKLHPIVTRLVDDEALKKMGAERMGSKPLEPKDGSA